jgi:ribosome-associated translation inhibitor RaiA
LDSKRAGPRIAGDAVRHLQRLTKTLPQESLFLRVVVERNKTRTLYRVAITLDLPGPNLATDEERHDLKEAVRDAVAESRAQLEKYREKLTHTYEYKRPARREQLRRLRAGTSAGKRERPR